MCLIVIAAGVMNMLQSKYAHAAPSLSKLKSYTSLEYKEVVKKLIGTTNESYVFNKKTLFRKQIKLGLMIIIFGFAIIFI
jgi:hypothetical protein